MENLNVSLLKVKAATFTTVDNGKNLKRERNSPESLKKITEFCELLS